MIDDLEEPDVDELHQAALREPQEPSEGREPVPSWMIVGFTLLIGWGGWYLGHYDAQFDTRVADMRATGAAPAAATAPAAPVDPAALGAQVYTNTCSACHQGQGDGRAGLAPPLAGSDWVLGDDERLIRVVLHGLTGPIVVSDEEWNLTMPAWAAVLSDDEVAAALTHVRSTWGNDAPPVDPADVAAIRASETRSSPWTMPEL